MTVQGVPLFSQYLIRRAIREFEKTEGVIEYPPKEAD